MPGPENKRIKADPGYGFCPVCGGLFKLDADKELPDHLGVGRGTVMCTGKDPNPDGWVSP